MGSVFVCSLFSFGVDVYEIRVEVNVSSGLPGFHIVGLADTAVQESKDRIRAALGNSGYAMPRGKIVVNLAPADVHKAGSSFDLPIALGILRAQGELILEDSSSLFVGELGLDGSIRQTQGVFLLAEWATAYKRPLYIAKETPSISSIGSDAFLFGAMHLKELVQALNKRNTVALRLRAEPNLTPRIPFEVDFADVAGHALAKRGLEIAATGEHHVCMWGPPGSGKSLLARAMESIIPPPSREEHVEIQRMHSLHQHTYRTPMHEERRPFRTPHHTSSSAALIGGGSIPKPGEISLAHRGILFLDELAEFSRVHINQLRQPLADGHITIARAKHSCRFPAAFQLIAATNPCPCGYYGDAEIACSCHEAMRERYLSKISGPILDRIDIHLHVKRQPTAELLRKKGEEHSSDVRARIIAARTFQQARNAHTTSLTLKNLDAYYFDKHALRQIIDLASNAHLSTRGFVKLLRIARSIADLEASHTVKKPHLEEAWFFKTSFTR